MPIPDLAPVEVASRLARLRDQLPEAGCDALLVSKLVNIRYLTGFTGSAALLVLLPAETLLVTDGRYGEQAEAQLAAAGVDARIEVATAKGQRDVVAGAVSAAGPAAGVHRLGLEAQWVAWATERKWATEWFAGIELVPTQGLVEGLRVVKDGGEVARVAAAAEIADQALGNVRHRLAEDITEVEFGLELDTEIRRLGATSVSFETIVASGPNGSRPHHRPGHRTIVDGDLVILDFGAVVDGYCSDMSRTVMVGEPSATQRRMLDVVAEAQAAGVAAVAAGADVVAVDAAARDVIKREDWGEAFPHGLGHGVGLEIHEAPRLHYEAEGELAAGHVVTVEPGVYLPGQGGVRIEDTVVVTAGGCRPVTLAPKDPFLP